MLIVTEEANELLVNNKIIAIGIMECFVFEKNDGAAVLSFYWLQVITILRDSRNRRYQVNVL